MMESLALEVEGVYPMAFEAIVARQLQNGAYTR